MTKRTNILIGIGAALAACAFAWPGCSSSSSSGNTGGSPPGTTPVTSAPYPTCTPLDPGSFVTMNGASYAVPTTMSCNPAGMPASGAADMHCAGMTPQPVSGSSCNVTDAGTPPDDDAGPPADAGPGPTPGPCDENGTDGAYGSTMYGTEGDDDDCKYHVTYTATPICENSGTYFVVTATHLTDNTPLTGASTLAEVCLNDTHPGPNVDSRPPVGAQEVVEGPPGTYTIGPIQFDAAGNWTVRFHFNEFCCDGADDSPHGHAAFFVTVP